jgi:hypothetical protein
MYLCCGATISVVILRDLIKICNKYFMELKLNSREWARFKRNFVGPIMPRSIRKQRREGVMAVTPAGSGVKKLFLDNTDIRKTWDRRAVHRNAMPKWANKDAIKNIYNLSKELTAATNIRHEVDHIIPIKHPLVCGLHVENNLQVIPENENRVKSNNFTIE